MDNPVCPELNPRYTMDNFVVGDENSLAYNVAKSICQGIGTRSPYIFYGNTGVGKSHLLMAIGNEIFSSRPSTRIIYVTSHLFQSQLEQAQRQDELYQFIDFYVNAVYSDLSK